jgi:hypothetical protein
MSRARAERLIEEGERILFPPDLASLSQREFEKRIASAKQGVIYAARVADYFSRPITAADPFALVSDAEIVRRLRRAERRLAVEKLMAEGVFVRSAVALTAPGPLPRVARRDPGEEPEPLSAPPPRIEPKREAPSGLLAHLDEDPR